jgi:hypothetical protein
MNLSEITRQLKQIEQVRVPYSTIKHLVNVEAFKNFVRDHMQRMIDQVSSNPDLTVDDVLDKVGGIEGLLVEWFNDYHNGWHGYISWRLNNGMKVYARYSIIEVIGRLHFDKNIFEEDFMETAFKEWEEKYIHGI